jgi:hypothetical protein
MHDHIRVEGAGDNRKPIAEEALLFLKKRSKTLLRLCCDNRVL